MLEVSFLPWNYRVDVFLVFLSIKVRWQFVPGLKYWIFTHYSSQFTYDF